MTFEHRTDKDQPCTRHPVATLEQLMALAVVGSRAPGFHHDVASKLQSLMMAIDEISELAHADPQVTSAAETAIEALREVLALLNVNRALTKPPTRTPVALRELLDRAAARVYVSLPGLVVESTVHVSAPSTIHALSLAFDFAAGPGRGRTLAVTPRLDPSHIELRVPCTPSPTVDPAEALSIASFVLARDGGSLRCTDDGSHLELRLPITAA